MSTRVLRSHRSLLLILMLGAWAAPPSACSAEERYALVIGNNQYEKAPLRNAKNDARLIGQTLTGLGFEVTERYDLGRGALAKAVAEFCRSLPEDSVACVYYAGHGLQVDGNNYLVPTDAQIIAKADVEFETIDQHRVIKSLSDSRSRVRIVILDCCLENPFDRGWQTTRNSADAQMAPLGAPPSGTIVWYSTGNGQAALDGEGDNSPFTEAVATAFAQRPDNGLLLTTAVAAVGADMMRRFGADQKPHLYVDASALTFELYRPDAGPAGQAGDAGMKQIKNALLDLANREPKPRPDAKRPPEELPATPADSDAFDDSLLAQADDFATAGDYDLAIRAYGAIVDDPEYPAEVRRQARIGRGRVYLRRGELRDLKLAILDYKAAKEPGIPLPVQSERVELRERADVTGTAFRNQVALITHVRDVNGKVMFYVKSVDRDTRQRGWLDSESLVDDTPLPPPPAAQPSASLVSKSAEPPRPKFTPTNAPNYSHSSSNSSRSSQQRTSSSNRVTNSGRTGGLSSGNLNIADPNNQLKSSYRENWTRNFQARTGRLPSIVETPWGETPREEEANWRARGVNGYGGSARTYKQGSPLFKQQQSTTQRSGVTSGLGGGSFNRNGLGGMIRQQYSGGGNRGGRGRGVR